MIKNLILRLLKASHSPVQKLLPFDVFAYLATGAANTLLNIVLFASLHRALIALPAAVELATLLAFCCSLFTGFWLQSNFAFSGSQNQGEKRTQFARYALVSLQGQISAYLLTKGFILVVNLEATMAYLVTTVIMLTFNYFLQKYFTFRAKKVTAGI